MSDVSPARAMAGWRVRRRVPGQIDRVPLAEDVGREWIATVWDRKNGRPHKCLERPAYVQIVPSLPWLRRIEA